MAEASLPHNPDLNTLYVPPSQPQLTAGEDHPLEHLEARFDQGEFARTRFEGPDGKSVTAFTHRQGEQPVDPEQVREHALRVGAIGADHTVAVHHDTADSLVDDVMADLDDD